LVSIASHKQITVVVVASASAADDDEYDYGDYDYYYDAAAVPSSDVLMVLMFLGLYVQRSCS